MRRYTETDLERYEHLVAEAREKVVRQQVVVDQTITLDGLNRACAVLDGMTETLAVYETERVRILEVLTK